jgi:virginiamycin B lyase
MSRLAALVGVLVLSACAAPEVSDAPTPSAAATAMPTATAPPSLPVSPSATEAPTPSQRQELVMTAATYPLPAGSAPHDVAPAADGGVWCTGQGNGTLGWFTPDGGEVREVPLRNGSAPHGVITARTAMHGSPMAG